MQTSKRRRPECYRWIIVACSFLIVAVTIGLGYNCWSIFTIPVCEDLELTRQQFSGLFTALLAGQMLGSLCVDTLISKLGTIGVIRFSVVALSVTTAAASQIRSSFMLYAVGLLLGFFLTGTAFLMFSIVIANWFIRCRGLMTGLVFMGSGLGSMVLIPCINSWIHTWGWQRALLLMAVIIAVITVPLSFFLLTATPQEAGLQPYGTEDATQKLTQDDGWGYTVPQLFHQPAFWLFLLFTLSIFLVTVLGGTIVPYLCDEGYSSTYAAGVQSACMGAIAVFRITAGRLCDKLGVEKTTLVFALLTPLVLAGLLLAPLFSGAAVLIVLGQGIGQAETIVCHPIIIGHLFGRKYYAKVYGFVLAFSSLVGAATPLIYGALYSRSGSYAPTYLLFALIYILGFLCLLVSVQVSARSNRHSPR